MKLELKHLAGYLPHGLKLKCSNERDDMVFHLHTIDFYIETIYMKDTSSPFGGVILETGLPYIKPILRPLSDLTKDIDGVVHISNIGRILEPKGSTVEYDGVYDFGWDVHVCDDYQGYSIGWRNDNNWFGIYFDEYDFSNQDECFTGDMIDFNIEAYEYLFKHHFDVYGLIENGLAVDINTI